MSAAAPEATRMRWGRYQVCSGQVEHVDAAGVTVQLAVVQPQPEQCAGCRACGVSGAPTRVRVPLRGDGQFRTGQTVAVRRFVVSPALAAATVFGLPLACMLAGLAAGTAALPGTADTPVLVVWAVVGLAAGALCAWLIQRLIDSRAGPPAIVEQAAAGHGPGPQA